MTSTQYRTTPEIQELEEDTGISGNLVDMVAMHGDPIHEFEPPHFGIEFEPADLD
jgi:hypothetical protein